jgi:hypothetical protein
VTAREGGSLRTITERDRGDADELVTNSPKVGLLCSSTVRHELADAMVACAFC